MGWFPRSSIVKKMVTGVTGLALFIFVAVHLFENLLLLSNNPDLYNGWAHFLFSFGPLLYVIEAILLLFFVVHIGSALFVHAEKRRARPVPYRTVGAAGKPSRRTVSSQTMIYTGLVLLVFLVWHVLSFRFGPNVAQGYVTQLDGRPERDLYRLVVDFFSNLWNVVIYVGVMVFLGFHLRHGFWSAFQSLGLYHRRWTPIIYTTGLVVALALGVGFIFIPIWIYLQQLGASL